MLMRMVPSLLVHWRLYAVWLERSCNGVPIRGRSKSPVPARRSLVAPDPLSLPNLISYRKGNAHTPTRAHVHTYVDHTSLGQLSVPVAFSFCRGLENEAIKSTSEASAPNLTSQTSPCPSFYKLGHGCTSASSPLHLA